MGISVVTGVISLTLTLHPEHGEIARPCTPSPCTGQIPGAADRIVFQRTIQRQGVVAACT